MKPRQQSPPARGKYDAPMEGVSNGGGGYASDLNANLQLSKDRNLDKIPFRSEHWKIGSQASATKLDSVP